MQRSTHTTQFFQHCFLLLLSLLAIGLLAHTTNAQGTLSGTVSGDDGEVLIGVNILVQGTLIGTASDLDGGYTLQVPAGEQTIVFSYTGFTTFELSIVVEDGATYTQDVVLNVDNLMLDELV